MLGESDGSPAQRSGCSTRPVLEPTPAEHLEVLDPDSGEWAAGSSASRSPRAARTTATYVLDAADGTIELGPAVRSPDGSWQQFGARPATRVAAAHDRLSRRRRPPRQRRGRHAERAKSAIPGVTSVTNPIGATGGVDLEAIESTRVRAAMELRTRYRAVTAEDFEFLCGEASPRVARALCLPVKGAASRLHRARPHPADRLLEAHELIPDDDLLREVAEYLDERRLVGTTVELQPGALPRRQRRRQRAGLAAADLGRVEDDVAHALYAYLNPLVGGSLEGIGNGWEFGRALNQGELYGIVHAVDGVDFVKILRVYETDIVRRRAAGAADGQLPAARGRRADRLGQARRQGRARGGLMAPTASPGRRRRRPGAGFSIVARPTWPRDAGPPSASARALHAQVAPRRLPRDDFAMRFVGALETRARSDRATLDSLPAYVDPRWRRPT